MDQTSNPEDLPLTMGFYKENIQTEFQRIDNRFEKLTHIMLDRFDKVDERFEQMDQRFSKFTDHLDFLFKKYEDFSQELTVIGYQLNRIEIRLEKIEQRLDRVEQRLDKVEQRVERIENVLVSNSKDLQELKERLIVLEGQQRIILVAIKDKAKHSGNLNLSNEKIEQELSSLKAEIAKIYQKIDSLESSLSTSKKE